MKPEFVADVRRESPCRGNGWCFAGEVLRASGMSERNISQMRLIFDLKWIESEKEKRDVGIDYAKQLFVEQYAAKFAQIYQDTMSHAQLFEALFQSPYPNIHHNHSAILEQVGQSQRVPGPDLSTKVT